MMVFIYPNALCALCMECYGTAIIIYPLNMIHIRGYTIYMKDVGYTYIYMVCGPSRAYLDLAHIIIYIYIIVQKTKV